MPQSPQKQIQQKETKVVICVSCYQEVTVELLPYGSGHIATCPKCERLAYSGE